MFFRNGVYKVFNNKCVVKGFKKENDENKYSKVFFCVSVKIMKDIKG